MPSFPIPVFGAIVLGFLCVRLWRVQGRVTPLVSLLLACGGQSLIIALAQHYGVTPMRFVQPVTATVIPPLAWFAFQTSAVRAPRQADLLHALVPLVALGVLLAAPLALDLLIPATFVIYGGAILRICLRGPDAQPRLYLQNAELPSRLWLVVGGLLIASMLSDMLIVASQIAGLGQYQPWIISIFSVGNLILIGILTASGQTQVDERPPEPEPAPQAAADEELFATITAYMAERRPYLDPDLTLDRLSRKMGIPAKTLSTTINLATGDNVSRFVNAARIKAAQDMLQQGEPVTQAMLASGFNTKSNFNREFLRVAGQSPSAWMKSTHPDASTD